MAIKKYTNGSWVSASRKYGTETDAITTLPATVIGDGTPISSYIIKGNMEQSGTPTPENPIMPIGCGDLVASGEHAGQYKLPLTLGSTTTNIYLGEVQTTRRIKKLVLTGEEAWSLWSSGQPDVERYYYKWGKTTPSDYGLICTHFPFIWSDGNFEHVRLGGGNRDDFVIFISKTIAPTLADFKSYLAAQYAAGTPVTVWYVLAEPETGIVNEPLMKIGDYVDSVSGTGLATSGTAQQFDVGTTLKPSEVDMTYHGWHEHEDTKYST